MTSIGRVLWLAVVTGTLLGACKEKAPPEGAAAAPSAPSAPESAGSAQPKRPSLYSGNTYPIPDGPPLAILPNEGVGPIRFGATVQTVERLMEKPCEIRTDDACTYPARAVDFRLKDGAVHEIRIHRPDRLATPMPKPRIYGVFNGRFVNGANFGMFPEAIEELSGKPDRKEEVKPAGEHGTVLVFHYRNMRLEFDEIDNGNVVLGGVILTAPRS